MKPLISITFGLVFAGSAMGQTLTDSFSYANGTNLHNLAGTGGINWKNHNLSTNAGATVINSGLSFADAGYSNFVSTGGAAQVSSAGAGAVPFNPAERSSLLYTDGLRAALGNVVYGSFLVKATSGTNIASAIYFDSGALRGTGSGAFSAGLYVGGGQYRTMAYNESTGSFNDLPTGKTTTFGQTDLVVFRYEQKAATNEQIFSVAINPTFSSTGITWDQTSIGLKGPSDFRTEFWTYHYEPNPFGTVVYDEIKFGTTLASVTPVPEPTTLSALGISLAGLAARRRQVTK